MRVKKLNPYRRLPTIETSSLPSGFESPTDSTVFIDLTMSSSPEATPWRDHIDITLRKEIHTKIVEYLHALKPNAPSKVMEKVPSLAHRMEEMLFTIACNEEEYKDVSTLPHRLTCIQQTNAKVLLQNQSPVVSPKQKEVAIPRIHLNEEQARIVFSCLQSWRQKLVNLYDTTPWEILPNTMLAKVAVSIPSTFQELIACGISSEQVERFGNSLLSELHKIASVLQSNSGAQSSIPPRMTSRSASPSRKRLSPASKTKPVTLARKGDTTHKRGHVLEPQGNKRRRKDGVTPQVNTSLPLPTSTMMRGTSGYLTPTSYVPSNLPVLLQRPTDTNTAAGASVSTPTSSLPALLPAPVTSTNGVKNSLSYNTMPFAQFGRLPTVSNVEQANRMLAQGSGLVTPQDPTQQQSTIELYEKEIQTLRWLLVESQREKTQLEEEISRLRQQVYQQQSL